MLVRGFFLYLETKASLDFFDSVKDMVDGLMVPYSLIAKEGIIREVTRLRMAAKGRPIIFDSNFEEGNEEAKDSLEIAEGIDGITILGDFKIERVRETVNLLGRRVYFKVDGIGEFYNRFTEEEKITFAREAGRNGCKGVIMCSRFPKRIEAVRKMVGNHLTILATDDDATKTGDGLSAGANYEILRQENWRTREVGEARRALFLQ